MHDLAAFVDMFSEMEIVGEDLCELKDSELKEMFVSSEIWQSTGIDRKADMFACM